MGKFMQVGAHGAGKIMLAKQIALKGDIWQFEFYVYCPKEWRQSWRA